MNNLAQIEIYIFKLLFIIKNISIYRTLISETQNINHTAQNHKANY